MLCTAKLLAHHCRCAKAAYERQQLQKRYEAEKAALEEQLDAARRLPGAAAPKVLTPPAFADAAPAACMTRPGHARL